MGMEMIYQEHSRTVFCYLLALTRDELLAEELTQETFYQALLSAHRFKEDSRVSTWLCAIARNQWNKYQAKHPPVELLTPEHPANQTTEEQVLQSLAHSDLMKTLHRMPEPYREVLYLRLFGDLSFVKIGEIMERSENWARVTFYRGKTKLKKELDGNEK